MLFEIKRAGRRFGLKRHNADKFYCRRPSGGLTFAETPIRQQQHTNMTSFDPDFFEREEITAIGGEFGPLGELAAIRLLCEVCRRGYYMPWDTIRKMSIIGKIPGLTPDMLDAIVARMAEYGIFSRRRLRDTDPVLTSADLQRRHIRRIGLARARRITSWPHLLIDLTAEFGIIPATVSGDSEPFDTPLPVDTRLPRRMQPYLKIRLRTSDPRLHVYRRIRNPDYCPRQPS